MHKGSSGQDRVRTRPSARRPPLSRTGCASPARFVQRPGSQHDADAQQQDHRPGEPRQGAPSPRREPPVGEQQQDVGPQEPHRGHPQPVAYPGHHDREGDRARSRLRRSSRSSRATPTSIHNRPTARQSQPTAFLGRLEAIRAPTSGKAKKRTPPTRPPTLSIGRSSGWEGRRLERGTTAGWWPRTWPE